jgi:hypothetical protein
MFHWLLLKTGELVIGARAKDYSTWQIVHGAAYHGGASDDEILHSEPCKVPRRIREHIQNMRRNLAEDES